MFDKEMRRAAVRSHLVYSSTLRHKNEQILLDQKKQSGDVVEIVSIAGSNDVIDWLQNLDLRQVLIPNSPGIKVSKGVFDAAANVISALDLDRKKTYQFEGHSKGGAVAQVAALFLHFHRYRIERVITFGAPRITRSKFANPFDVTNAEAMGDPVPWVPRWLPWRPFRFGWRHNGQRIRIGRATMASRTNEWFLIRRMIKSHLMPNYLNLLGA